MINYSKMINNVTHGDTLEIMKSIPDNAIDFLLVDLPYGTTQNKWDSVIPLDQLWAEYHRIVKGNGAMVFTASSLFTASLMLSNPKEYKYSYIWIKSKSTNFLNAKKQPLRKHEDIVVFYRKQPTYHPQMTKGEAYSKGIRKNQVTGSYGDFAPTLVASAGGRYPVDTLYFKTAESEGPVVHPTQKPVSLGRYLVQTFTNPGDTVLDNTSGSGSFLISALLEGRNFVGIEKNEDVALFKRKPVDYIEITKSRVSQALTKMLNANSENLKYLDPVNLLNIIEGERR